MSALLRTRPHDPQAMIYIVDDDEAVRDSLRLLLIAMGFAVEDFADADLFFARGAPHQGKCLILDVNLPGASGIEVLGGCAEKAPRYRS